MTSSINGYSDFIKGKDNDLFASLKKALETEKMLGFYQIEMAYLEKIEGIWLGFTKTICCKIEEYLPPLITEDDSKLYDRIKKELDMERSLENKSPEHYSASAIFALPVESAHVRIFLQNLRAMRRIEFEDSLQPVKKAINKISNSIFKDSSKEYRVLSKKLIIKYFPLEGQHIYFTESLEEDYRKECATCHQWQTTAKTLSICARCLKACYCNVECQTLDWKSHKVQCLNK